MGQLQTEKIQINHRDKSAQMVINVADFVDHGHVVVYAPSLNISAYGETKDEALKMLFEEVLVDYFHNLFQLTESELTKELAKYNWKRSKILRKRFSNSAYVDSEGILKNFNLPKETLINQRQMSPSVKIAA